MFVKLEMILAANQPYKYNKQPYKSIFIKIEEKQNQNSRLTMTMIEEKWNEKISSKFFLDKNQQITISICIFSNTIPIIYDNFSMQ